MEETLDLAISAERLTLSWDGRTPVVEDVSLHVRSGEICCLVGRSGCGKTTILHALAGIGRPLSGRVLLHGADITGKSGSVSYQLQKDLLLPNLRVIDNVCLPLTLSGMTRPDAYEKATPLLERFGLSGSERQWPSELSGGMRQRAAFLRTYLMGNDVVLLDEPFSALDALTRSDVRYWFCDMVGELGLSVLIITHDVDEAILMARRIYVLSGNPSAGMASHIVSEIAVSHGAEGGVDFSREAFEARRQVMKALGERSEEVCRP